MQYHGVHRHHAWNVTGIPSDYNVMYQSNIRMPSEILMCETLPLRFVICVARLSDRWLKAFIQKICGGFTAMNTAAVRAAAPLRRHIEIKEQYTLVPPYPRQE